MVAEGLRLVGEAAAAGLPVTHVFYTEELAADSRGAAVLGSLEGRSVPLWEVPPEVMAALSDTETPQGIVAVLPAPELAPVDGLILIPDGLRDPGNLGTLLRTAWAAGVGQILLPPGTVDWTSPKVVRSGMGAHFHLPIRRASWETIREITAGGPVWLAESEGGIAYDRVDWKGAAALIVGGEAEGAGTEARSLAAGHHVYIPMAPGVESLNAAIAAGILLFEAARHQQK